MAKRGKVLRDPHVGPGLLIVEGRQHSFYLEGVWKSEVPPKPGLVVDVDFDARNQVTGITAVPEAQSAKQQAELSFAAAKTKGAALASTAVAKFGLPQLIAAGLLIFSWSFLTAASVQLPFLGRLEFTFWQVLGYLNSGNLFQSLERHANTSSGSYGLLAWVVVCGPFLHHFWRDKRAALGGLLPLAFMLVIGVLVRSSIQGSFAGPTDGLYGNVQRQAQAEMMQAVSLGGGTFLSMFASFYFAALGLKQFLMTKRSEPERPEQTHKAAA